ncbi:MAG: SLBB domain-containing protein [Acidobacteria bacterium]|nr:SLBB domain-containing protein [Acidobacteriota bacterium]
MSKVFRSTLLFTFLFIACHTGLEGIYAQGTSVSVARQRPDLVHFGDLLDIDVVGSLEFDWRGGLTPEGFLEGYDHVEEPIAALCRTEAQVAEAISKQLSTVLRDPKVNVRILDRSNRALAYIDGAVRIPQRLRLNRPVRLNEIIVVSGGITDTASGDISIYRRTDLSCVEPKQASDRTSEASTGGASGPTEIINIKIEDILSGVAEANPFIVSGDMITVGQAQPVYVIGGVNNPRSVSTRAEITVARAILSAGGMAKDGLRDSVTIYRRAEGALETINVSFEAIQEGKSEDIVLKPFDIVDVGQKGRAKRRFPPSVENMPGEGGTRTQLPLRIID